MVAPPKVKHRWILLFLLAVAGAQMPCHDIDGTLTVLNDPNVCTVDSTKNELGNSNGSAVLDFSQADPDILNAFLEQKDGNNEYIFKTIHGAVIMDGNPDVEEIDLAGIETWKPGHVAADGIFINIRFNPLLKKLSLNSQLSIKASTVPVHIHIYNNPLLEQASLDAIAAAVEKTPNLQLYLQKAHECQFFPPGKPEDYYIPNDDDFVSKCQTIKGDFILAEESAPRGKVTLEDGVCLVLTGVDMTNFTIEFPSGGQGVAVCADGRLTRVERNKGLCRAKFTAVFNYLPNLTSVIKSDDSCFDCSTSSEVNDKASLCLNIYGDHNLNSWFEDKLPDRLKLDLLKKAARLTVVNSQAKAINLPGLKQAEDIEISGNSLLERLSLGEDSKEFDIKSLTISENDVLTDIIIPTAKTVRIIGNKALQQLLLTRLEDVDTLEIVDNPALTNIILGVRVTLKRIRTLNITRNGALELLKINTEGDLTRLIIVDNPNLETLLQMSTPTWATITGNPKILYSDFRRIFPFAMGVQRGWQMDCYMPAGTVIHDYGEIRHCTAIHGAPLILDGLRQDVPYSALEKVENCIFLRNSELTKADFLENVTTSCPIVLENNLNLCRPNRSDSTQVRIVGQARTKGCDLVSCKALGYPPHCQVFVGHLVINNYAAAKLSEGISHIYGSLTIMDLDRPGLESTVILPNLVDISGYDVPILQIKNNAQLEMIKMPKLKKIEQIDGTTTPVVKIVHNAKLSAVDFVPNQKCHQEPLSWCHFDQYYDEENSRISSEKTWYIAGVILVVLGNVLGNCLLSVCLYVVLRWGTLTEEGRKKRAEEKRRAAEERAKKALLQKQEKEKKLRMKEKEEYIQVVKEMEAGLTKRVKKVKKGPAKRHPHRSDNLDAADYLN